MTGLTPKHWVQFQHYKNRRPRWIKLHHALLDDYEFSRLPVASRALAPCIWLLASEYQDGCITASLAEVAFRVHLSEDDLKSALIPLIERGFLVDASNLLADCYQPASLEKRESREEKEILSDLSPINCKEEKTTKKRKKGFYGAEFEAFWLAYPTTQMMAKKLTAQAWANLSEADRTIATATLPAFKAFLASKPDHAVLHACRYLSQRRFDGFAQPQPSDEAMRNWQELQRKTEEYRRKVYGEDKPAEPVRNTIDGSGTQSTDQNDGSLFSQSKTLQ